MLSKLVSLNFVKKQENIDNLKIWNERIFNAEFKFRNVKYALLHKKWEKINFLHFLAKSKLISLLQNQISQNFADDPFLKLIFW